MTPGCFTSLSPPRNENSTRYFPGLTLNVNPPALLVVTRCRSLVAMLMTSTVRPSMAPALCGPRTVPLIVPSDVTGLGPVSMDGTPRRHPTTPTTVKIPIVSQVKAGRGARERSHTREWVTLTITRTKCANGRPSHRGTRMSAFNTSKLGLGGGWRVAEDDRSAARIAEHSGVVFPRALAHPPPSSYRRAKEH